ncbi:hypothetical protein J437_LFUL003804 [Ladona fulva]|uniref:DNA-directed RNA polymerase I subunit RPA43 n=1 Tax=Ladona fulva TaxID=123851 RepID=A0A8K0NYP0_LADFU|nr:hypothetical protein J437_LFUL003804 [Ladona fulva]
MTDTAEIKYSASELSDLVQRSHTCVALQRKTRVLYLNPVQFSNIKSGIRESLDSLLFKYDFFFKAIVLGYRKIKLLTRYGAFCYRSSKVSLQIEADFYLFNPDVGSKLQGVICKRSGHHLGVLVHKAFTVFLPLDENNYETGWDFAIGQEVEFEVVSLDLTSGPLPYIKGKLIKEDKDGNEKEGEGTMVGADGEGSYGNEWGGSDSGVASSTGRESEDSDDSERNDVSEGSMKKSTIEEWTYKRPLHKKSKGGFGDELMKVMERETASEDESGIYSSKTLERSDPYATGETSSQELPSSPTVSKKRKSILKKKKVELLSESESSNKSIEACNTSVPGVSSSQESCSDFPSPPPVPKKRKSILKVHKDISCDTDVTNSYSTETFNTSLLTKPQESALEGTSTSLNPKERKSILKKPKETISSVDDKAEGLKEKSESIDAAEIYKSPVKSHTEIGVSEIDDKSKSILKNIVRDLSPRKLGTESVKSILETLEKSESEKSVAEDSIDTSKAVSKPRKRMSAVKAKEVISSSDDEDLKGSESRTTISETSALERLESKGVPANDGKGRNSNSPAEKQTSESKMGEKTEDQEKSDDSATKKKKRKSLSKSKKRTSLLYESLAEKIRETTGVTNEEYSEASVKGHGSVSTPVPKKVDVGNGNQNSNVKSVKKTSPEVAKKKLPKKKGGSPDPEDLVKQLLKNMEKAIDGDESLEIAEKINAESSSFTEGKDVNESKSLKANVKADSTKKAGGKRKSLSKKKDEPSLSVEDMIKRLTETAQSPVAKHGISPEVDIDEQLKPNGNTEIEKRLSLDGAPKDGSKKKSRKSVGNLIPITEEKQTLGTTEIFVKDDKISLPVTSMEENGNKFKSPGTLDGAESSAKTLRKQRQSMGEKKPKTQKLKVDKGTPQGEKEDTGIQIEKLLMLNKKLLGLGSVDTCEDQGDKVSNEEKKSKKRKRESSGMKDSSKKRKTSESVSAEIPNLVST